MEKIIKTKDVIFTHSKFYDLIELNLVYLLTILVKLVIKILDFLKTKLISNQYNLKNEYNNATLIIENNQKLIKKSINQRHQIKV